MKTLRSLFIFVWALVILCCGKCNCRGSEVQLAWDNPTNRTNFDGINLYYGRENRPAVTNAGLPPVAAFTNGWTNKIVLSAVTNAVISLQGGYEYTFFARSRGTDAQESTNSNIVRYTPVKETILSLSAVFEGRPALGNTNWTAVTNIALPPFTPIGTNVFWRVRVNVEQL